jgi:iron-sulfur cluster assembly accessory protein
MNKNLLSITSTALTQLKNIIKQHNCKAINLSLKSGGCNGFEYKLKPDNEPLKKKDELFAQEDVNIHVCGKSLLFLIGSKIDYSDDIMGQTFTFTNPNAQNTCGCGTSFNPKVDYI